MGLSENGEVFQVMANKSFSEFVDTVLKEWHGYHACNEHWRPYYMHCNYCNIKYDTIGKIEHFEAGIEYIAQVTNLTNILPNKKSKYQLHPSGGKRYSLPINISEKHKKEKVNKYFSQLNTEQLERLFSMYKIDFEMFGYDVKEYLQ